jgi:arginyl-tRNA synthetase
MLNSFRAWLAGEGLSGIARPYMLNDNNIGYCVNAYGIDHPSVTNGYINYFIEPKAVIDHLSDFTYTKHKTQSNIAIEYGQLNTHKNPHLGHLRNICIGKALSALSNDVCTNVTYLGDHGMHVAKCMVGLRAGIKDIQEAYEYGNNQSEDIVCDEMAHWNAEDILYKDSRAESISNIRHLFDYFGVKFSDYAYESDFLQKDILIELLSDIGYWGNDKYSDCFVVDTDCGTIVLIKADGTLLYAGKDILLAQNYSKRYDEVLYVVGQEQIQYFKQLSFILNKLFPQTKIKHIDYGLVTTQGSKISSRAGASSAWELIDHLESIISKTYHCDIETTQIIVSNIIYYEMLKSDYKAPVKFIDDDQYIKNQGISYIMYQYCRAKTITMTDTDFDTFIPDTSSIKLLRSLLYSTDNLDCTNPQKLFSTWSDIAASFSNFYTNNRINGNPQALALTKIFINVNNILAYLLDIRLPERM